MNTKFEVLHLLKEVPSLGNFFENRGRESKYAFPILKSINTPYVP